MNEKDNVRALGPDGYSRFFVIMTILERLYEGTKDTVKVLDIGGCSPYLATLLKASPVNFELTILDILPKPDTIDAGIAYIQGDATKNELPENSFDVVVSTDTLEHIPKDLKDNFVRACVRLAKDACVIAAPFETRGVHAAEGLVNDFNKRLFGVGQDWLEEHFHFTKPSVESTCKVLDGLKVRYEHFGTNNLYSWVISSHLNLIAAKVGVDESVHRRATIAYNTALAHSSEFDGPSYRHFFTIFKGKTLQPEQLPPATARPDPQVFSTYLHEMFVSVYEQMVELLADTTAAKQARHEVLRQLENQQAHSHKLQKTIEEQNQELQRLAPLKKLLYVRHPRQALRKIKHKLSGKN